MSAGSRRWVCCVLVALLAAVAPAQLPGPQQALGHEVGADGKLADYTQLRAWWDALAAASDRIRVERIGTTSYGQPMVMATISAPQNLARLDRLREIARMLARGEAGSESAAQVLAAEGRAVVWVDGGLHATESIAGQNILELVWRMVSRDDEETQRIRERVVLLVCPANPDGMEMVARGYRAIGKVGQLPVLYQRYIGHDNNRDHYRVAQPETEAIAQQLYRRWYPQIVYNHHQSAPRGTVIFTPPFRDPFHYQFDPILVRGIDLVAAHMNARFAWEGKPGVISRGGAAYSTWWNGGLRTTAYFHNQIGILTEVFGSPDPVPLRQTLDRRLPSGDYPAPVGSQVWRARDTVEYLQTANFAILDLASRYATELQFNAWRMARNAIAKGSADHWTVTPRLVAAAQEARKAHNAADAGGAEADAESGGGDEAGAARDPEPEAPLEAPGDEVFRDPARRDPRGYVLTAAQEPRALAAFVAALQKTGIDVLRAEREFAAGGHRYPAGSFVVQAAQAFRPHLLDMFEPQWHPDDLGKDGQPVPPYDSAGWTLALQMGVQFDRMLDAFEGPFAPVTEIVRVPQPAAPVVPAGRRVGLFDVYGGNMAVGWTEWVLREHGVPVQLVFGQTIEQGGLREQFDTLLFHAGLPNVGGPGRTARALERASRNRLTDEQAAELAEALPPFEDWSTVAARRVRISREAGVAHLREFVEQGGTLIALGDQVDAAVRLFELPVRTGVWVADGEGEPRRARRSEFFIPGSLVRVRLDPAHALCRDLPPDLVAVWRSSTMFTLDPARDHAHVRVVARYADSDILASGWALGIDHLAGKPAILEIPLGKGRILLFGPDIVYRGQPWASHRLLLRAL